MSRKKNKRKKDVKSQTPQISHFLIQRLNEGLLIIFIAFAGFLLLSLCTYNSSDPSWSNLVNTSHVHNAGGRAGAWMADVLLHLLGYLAYFIPFLFAYNALKAFNHRKKEVEAPFKIIHLSLKLLGFIIVACSGSALASLLLEKGGVLGDILMNYAEVSFNIPGTGLVLVTLFLIGVTLFTGLSWVKTSEYLGNWTIHTGIWLFKKIHWPSFKRTKKEQPYKQAPPPVKIKDEPLIEKGSVKIEHSEKKPKVKPKQFVESEEISKDMRSAPRYAQSSNQLPSLNLLDSYANKQKFQMSSEEMELLSRKLETNLADFGVQVQVVDVHPGPVVTRFELQLAAGTKVSKISNLSKDLARSLSVVSVRVVEVIPGKSVIGLELPNRDRETVGLQEVLASKAYANSRSALSMGLGKDIGGNPVIVDLAKMPHLLVAGTTGAGKSVSLNVMLLSMLYKATPQQLRMIMIDPKMLELSVYEGIPHLLTPVVTDMRDAASALRWCVVEMERRYRLMAALGVRNIAGYNAKVHEAVEKGAPLLDPLPSVDGEEQKVLQELPQILVLADEFADMMVVVGKKVETLIARLAQKARAAGVHLILATQRPSVDVITGLIKANIPTRIAFQVSSKIDSRTILDQSGAEQLLGHGDMLYLAPGTGVPVRVHGAYVSDDEVHRVVADWRQKGKPQYLDEILQDISGSDSGAGLDGFMPNEEGNAEQDPLYDEAVSMVAKARKVSVSSIQRRFKIGYNRAARIVEAMENAGVVSQMESNGSREVLVPVTE